MSNNEIWKDIKDFEGIYQVSNKGRIKSLERTVTGKLNSIRTLPEKFITPTDNGKGYMVVALYKDDKRHFKKMHRLVAEAFIPNPDNKPEVNHIDGNKKNNTVENLEWNTTKENCEHRQKTGLGNTENARKSRMKPIECYDINTGKIISTYDCAASAARALGCKNDAISRVVRGDRSSYKGMGFRLID